MVEGYGKRLRVILHEHGWELLRRAKGDHEIWWHPPSGRKITIDRGSRARGLTLNILKKAGIKAKL